MTAAVCSVVGGSKGIGPEDGTHVPDLVGTDKGWFAVEPQTGAIVELEKYPNLKTIIGVNFG